MQGSAGKVRQMVSPACMLMLDVICVFASCLLPANGFAALYGLCLHPAISSSLLIEQVPLVHQRRKRQRETDDC